MPLFQRLILTAGAGLLAAHAAHAQLVIDNFKHTVSNGEVLQDNSADGVPVTATYLPGPGPASFISASRQVSVDFLQWSGVGSRALVQFGNGGLRLGLTNRTATAQPEAQVLLHYEGLSLDAAALGSRFTLTRVMNHMPSGLSSPVNTPDRAVAIGQQVTLTLTDGAGRQASLLQPIPYLGTQFNPFIIENTRFDVSFGLGELLADNPALNLAQVSALTLRFDFSNHSGFPETIYFGDGTASGLVLGGDPFPFTPPPIPEPGTWALLLAGLAAIGGVAARRRAAG